MGTTYPAAAGDLPVARPAQHEARAWPVVLATAFAVIVAMNLVHEAGHALAAKALGYDVLAQTNHVGVVGGQARSLADATMISAAGPLVTIAIALLAFPLARRGSATAAMVVFAALWMRLIAAVVSLSYPNDEARIAIDLGLGQWTIFGIVIALLAGLAVATYRRFRFSWKWLLAAYVGASLGSALVVLGEPLFPVLRF